MPLPSLVRPHQDPAEMSYDYLQITLDQQVALTFISKCPKQVGRDCFHALGQNLLIHNILGGVLAVQEIDKFDQTFFLDVFQVNIIFTVAEVCNVVSACF